MTVAVAASLMVACSDDQRITAPVVLPSTPTTPSLEIGELRATVDVVAGTMTFEPITQHGAFAGASVISTAIYGNQNVTVRIYNSPVVAAISPTNPAKKTFSANVGIRNLLPYPIGDEQSVAAPTDTIGIDVFMGAGPSVTGTSSVCSPACTVTVKNPDGARAFNAPSQKYWHYHDRLGAAGSSTDTTRARRLWVFEADTAVTNFSFNVVVNAPWPAPYETRWKVSYEGDSVPESSAGSIWQQVIAGAGGTLTLNSPSAGLMTLETVRKTTQAFTRYDSLGSTSSAYIEARMRRNDGSTKPEEVVIGMADGTKFIAIGLTSSRVGFLNASYAYSGTSYAVSAGSFHTYQIRKFAADSVQLLVDGTRIASRTYASMTNAPAGSPSAFFFGGPGAIIPGPKNVADQSTTWDYVIYEIGVSTP
jgi:hypothetical protein